MESVSFRLHPSVRKLECNNSSENSGESARRLEELSINKLQFGRLDLCGRTQETKQLTECLKHIVANKTRVSSTKANAIAKAKAKAKTSAVAHPNTTLVLISGKSGTGKTVLVDSLRRQVNRFNNGVYITGKFDMNRQIQEPYSGIKEAISDLCHQLLNPSKESSKIKQFDLQKLKRQLNDELGNDMGLLVSLIPILEEIVDEGNVKSSTEGRPDATADTGLNDGLERLKYAFRRLLRVLCRHFILVWSMDDLQWADRASMEIFQCIVSDRKSSLLMIGSYRDDGLVAGQPANDRIQDLEIACGIGTEVEAAVCKIHLKNLNKEDICEMLIELLSANEVSQVQGLAKIVHQRTFGNAFYVVQFLQSLVSQKLLSYNLGAMQWQWSDDKIRQKCTATENVIDLMKAKLFQVPAAKEILPTAACLGSTFKTTVLCAVMDGFHDEENESNFLFFSVSTSNLQSTSKSSYQSNVAAAQIRKDLKVCEAEGLIESVDSEIYRFVHDRIQEAALLLLPQSELIELQFRIGDILRFQSDEEALEKMLFAIVNMLNARLPKDEDQRLDIAGLNHRAGIKAMSYSAFDVAAVYFEQGIKLLPADNWETEYKLSVDLYSCAAEAEAILGNQGRMKYYSDCLLNQEACTITDKLRVYHCLMQSYYLNEEYGSMENVTNLGLNILAQVDIRFPKGKFAITVASLLTLRRVKIMTKNMTKENFDSLPVSTDPKTVGTMKILHQFTCAAFFANPDLIVLACLKMIQITLHKGVTAHAPVAFAILSALLTNFLGDVTGGQRSAEQSAIVQNRFDPDKIDTRSFYILTNSVSHWTTPFQTCLVDFLKGYRLSMAAGDTDSTVWNLYQYLDMVVLVGKPLATVDLDTGTYVTQMKALNSSKTLSSTMPTWQAVMNLRGTSSHTTTLTGDAMNEEELFKQAADTKDHILRALVYKKKMFLACYFGNHDLGADLAVAHGDESIQSVPSASANLVTWFVNALSCYAMARQTRLRKYRTQAKKSHRMIRLWLKRGNPNCIHYNVLLNAEKAVMQGKRKKARDHYNRAVLVSGRIGLIHDQALANERLALFYLEDGNSDDASYCMTCASKLYGEWGANRKVLQLEHDHPRILDATRSGWYSGTGSSRKI